MNWITTKLQTYFNRNTGIVNNMSNCRFENDGENIHFIIPITELDKWGGYILNSSSTTKYIDKDGHVLYGKSTKIIPKKGEVGFDIYPLN